MLLYFSGLSEELLSRMFDFESLLMILNLLGSFHFESH